MSTGLVRCNLVGKEWVVSGDPFVLTRLKRVFSQAKQSAGTVKIPATPEQSRDLLWFRQRYPMSTEPESKLRSLAARFVIRQQRGLDVVSGAYKPEPVKFARGESPRDYQWLAANLLKANQSLLLADDVGLGKTVSTIAAIADPALRPACVIIPTHLGGQWRSQIKRFLPHLSVHIIKQTSPYDLSVMADCPSCGACVDVENDTRRFSPTCPVCKRKLPSSLPRRPADVTILAYSKMLQWPNLIGQTMKTVVFEEAHALRTYDTQRWRAARSIAKQVEYRIGLSATPLFNLGGEAWNILECINPGFLGERREFQETWCGYASATKEPPLLEPESFGSYLRSSNIMLRRTALEVGASVHDCKIIHQTVDSDTAIFDKATSHADEMAKIILGEAVSKTKGVSTMQFDSMMRQATGLAKCMAPGTMVLKPDLSSVAIESIKVGDSVMGPDGKPRRVRSINSGYGPMYKVESTTKSPLFEPYVVNGDHILALKHSGEIRHGDRFIYAPYLKGDHLEISVSDYLGKSKSFRRMLKGYKANAIEMPEMCLPIDPYFIGLWLGDGTSKEAAVTTADKECVEYLEDFSRKMGLRLMVKAPHRTAPTYRLSSGIANGKRNRNCVTNILKSLDLIGNKHIPRTYLQGSISQRKALLAGLIDSDGHLACTGCYVIATKWKHLAEQIASLAWSLGCSGKIAPMEARSQTGRVSQVWRVQIVGEGLESLPLKVPHKKTNPRKQIKDPLRSGITVTPIGDGDYHGFELEGDGLYLLRDHTVTHNCPAIAAFVEMLLEQEESVVLFAWHQACHAVYMERLAKWNPVKYTGTETIAEKEAAVERFIRKESKVIVISLRAGEGLDGLQFASCTAVIAELDWTWSVPKQNIGRIARDGQKRPCTAYFMVSEFGSDPVMSQAIGLKKDQLNGLIGERVSVPTRAIDGAEEVRKLARLHLDRRRLS